MTLPLPLPLPFPLLHPVPLLLPLPIPLSQVFEEVWERGKWLVMLMIFQSLASMVLAQFEDLIKAHVVIALFLTMLIGSGGNAGGQSVCVCVSVCLCLSLCFSVSVCVCNLSLDAHPSLRLITFQFSLPPPISLPPSISLAFLL